MIRDVMQLFADRRRTRNTLNALSRLQDFQLDDIGLTRDDVRSIAARGITGLIAREA